MSRDRSVLCSLLQRWIFFNHHSVRWISIWIWDGYFVNIVSQDLCCFSSHKNTPIKRYFIMTNIFLAFSSSSNSYTQNKYRTVEWPWQREGHTLWCCQHCKVIIWKHRVNFHSLESRLTSRSESTKTWSALFFHLKTHRLDRPQPYHGCTALPRRSTFEK
jgi:hypothetical protein